MIMTIKGQQQKHFSCFLCRNPCEVLGERDHIDLQNTLPRALPLFPYLTEEEMQQLADIHPFAPPLRGISDYDVNLVQRLLYYTRQDLWLSESGQEWHYPLLITLREKDRNNWRNRSIEAWEARWGKGAQQEERQRQNRTISGIAFSAGF